MTKRLMSAALFLAVLAGLLVSPLAAQAPVIKKAYLGQPMSDFELPALDGKTVKLSALQGRNVMLVFPRVFYAANEDCSLCAYQYAELGDYFQRENWKDKYNLEILYVFPFSAEVTRSWISRLPAMLETVDGWKNPKTEELKNDQVKSWMEVTRRICPNKYAYAADKIPMPFPILLDEKRELSKGLDLFREEWGGGKGDQNIPSIFILDKTGVVGFKYIGQHTVDRPGAAYLEKILKAVF
jgi:peroxiredoxin